MDHATSYPAAMGGPVTQGHADYCKVHGHATHTSDGVDQGVCPRCGQSNIVGMDTLRAASETLLDVCLPDGAMGTVESFETGPQGRIMATVCGYSGGRPFTRRVPATAITPSVALERYMCERFLRAVKGD